MQKRTSTAGVLLLCASLVVPSWASMRKEFRTKSLAFLDAHCERYGGPTVVDDVWIESIAPPPSRPDDFYFVTAHEETSEVRIGPNTGSNFLVWVEQGFGRRVAEHLGDGAPRHARIWLSVYDRGVSGCVYSGELIAVDLLGGTGEALTRLQQGQLKLVRAEPRRSLRPAPN